MRTAVLIGVAALVSSAALAQTSPFTKLPTAQDLEQYYPPAAKAAQVGGLASITCQVKADGALDACAVANEQPAGLGFGEAALKLAPLIQMRTPVASAKVTVPIRFDITAPAGQAAAPMTGPRFVARPSAEDIDRVYPRAARQARTDGAASIHCTVTALGEMSRCTVASETPGGQGFGAAALKLAPQFKLNPLTFDGKPVAGGEITIPITFKAS